MKEVTRISLAALPYNIEVDAKKELEKYLQAVERSLGADADAMKEIEARVAELLADRNVTDEKVVSSADVEAIRGQLGRPADFADSEAREELARSVTGTAGEKRLMRDTNDQILGGVCSGLAAYLPIDTVWVRLAMVVLAIVTSGAMIPIYIVMWLIMPPARTAAERLQMKGQPVTLEAIQEESSVVAKQGNERKMILTILRIMAGIGALIIAAAASMAIVGVTYQVLRSTEVLRTLENEEKIYFALMVLAGITAVVFCMMIARALFSNQYTKRFWMILAVLTVLGIGLFSTGALGIRFFRSSGRDIFERQWVHKSIDATAMNGAKQLKVAANMPFNVTYTVDPSRREATVSYSKFDAKVAPAVQLVRNGDVLTVSLKDNEASCPQNDRMCQRRFIVEMIGPMLDAVQSQQTIDMTYHTTAQKSLHVTTNDQSNLTIISDSLIDSVVATAMNESTVSFLPASIASLDVTTGGSQSAVLVAKVKMLSLHIPEACGMSSNGMINISRAEEVTVNGTPYDTNKEYACTTIRFMPET